MANFILNEQLAEAENQLQAYATVTPGTDTASNVELNEAVFLPKLHNILPRAKSFVIACVCVIV